MPRASPWSSSRTSPCARPCRRWRTRWPCCGPRGSRQPSIRTSLPSTTSSTWCARRRRSRRRMPMNRRDRHVLLTSSPHPPAVVVGLDNITGLQTARILDARGVAVVGIAADLRHFGSRTNACAHVVESPLSGEPLVAALRELAKRLGRMAVLVPCTDESVRTLSERRGDLAASYHLPLGDHAVVTMLMDKVCFAEHARAAGLAIPHTVVLRNRDEAERAARSMPFPAVLKPPMKSARWLE